MSDFKSAKAERLFNRSLSIIIPTDVCDEEFDALLQQSILIDRVRQQLVKSDISFDDYLDAVEFFGEGINMDKYCNEVETKLNNYLNDLC